MQWITIIHGEHSTLPEEGEEVLFDHEENPPIYGRIKYNGIFPSVLVLDSSGEESHEAVANYSRWLDVSPSYKEQELRAALENLMEAIPKQTENADWWEDNLTHAFQKATEALKQ